MKENQVRFPLWKPKSGADWPIAGSIYDQTDNCGRFKPNRTLTDLSAFIQAAINHGDKLRIAIFPNNRKEKDSQPDFHAVVSVAGEYRQGEQKEHPTGRIVQEEPLTDDDLPF